MVMAVVTPVEHSAIIFSWEVAIHEKWLGIDGKSVQFVVVVCFMVFICCVMSVLVLQSCSVFEFMCLLANI
jgi:hypothetical protein